MSEVMAGSKAAAPVRISGDEEAAGPVVARHVDGAVTSNRVPGGSNGRVGVVGYAAPELTAVFDPDLIGAIPGAQASAPTALAA